MIHLWFGDSYVIGAELSEHYGKYSQNDLNHRFVRPLRDRPDLAFPHLVSSHFNQQYINFGHGGSSIEFQIYLLTLFCKNEIKQNENYVAFFCLPFTTRRFHINNDHQWNFLHYRKWWKNNEDLLYIDHVTASSLNHLYLLSRNYNIIPYFLPLYFPIETLNLVNIVPNESWLIDKNSNLVSEAWGIKNPPNTWRTLKSKFDKKYYEFINPCGNHPNLLGHKKIAELIIGKLYEK